MSSRLNMLSVACVTPCWLKSSAGSVKFELEYQDGVSDVGGISIEVVV